MRPSPFRLPLPPTHAHPHLNADAPACMCAPRRRRAQAAFDIQSFLKQVAAGTPPPVDNGGESGATDAGAGAQDASAGLLGLLQGGAGDAGAGGESPRAGEGEEDGEALGLDANGAAVQPAGVALPANAQYDVDSPHHDAGAPPALEVTPIAKYASEAPEALGSLVAGDGRFICYGLKAGQVRLIDAVTANRALIKGHTSPVTDLAFATAESESCNRLASVGSDGRLLVHELSAGDAAVSESAVACIEFGAVPEGSATPRVAWSPAEGADVLACATGGRVVLVTLSALGGAAAVQCPAGAFVAGVTAITGCGEVTDLAFSPSGDILALVTRDRKLFEVDVGTAVATEIDFHREGAPTHGPLSFVAFYDEAHVIVGALDNTVFAVVKREGGEVSCRVRLLSSEQPTGAFFNNAFLLATPFAGSVLVVANARAGALFALPVTGEGETAVFRSLAEFAVAEPIGSFTAVISADASASAPCAELYCMNAKAIQQYTLPLAACMASEDAVADALDESFVPAAEEIAEPTSASSPALATSVNPTPPPPPPASLLSPTKLMSPQAFADPAAPASAPMEGAAPAVKLLRRPANEAAPAAPAAPAAAPAATSNAALENMSESLSKVVLDAEERVLAVLKATRPTKGEGSQMQADMRAMEDRVVKRVGDMLASRDAEQKGRADRTQEGIKALTGALSALPDAIAGRVEQSLRQELAGFGKALVPAMTSTMASTVQTATASAVGEAASTSAGAAEAAAARGAAAAVAKDLPKAAAGAVAEAFRGSFQAMLLPAIDAGLRQMMEQVGSGIDRGVAAAAASAAPAAAAVSRLEAAADALQASASAAAAAAASVPPAVSPSAESALAGKPGGAVSLASLEQSLDPSIELRGFLERSDFEGAFNRALSLSDVDTVAWLCTQVAPSGVASRLSQGVLLSLTQQLGYNLEKHTSTKLEWLQEVVMALDTRSPTVVPHLGPVLSGLYGQLTTFQRSGECPPSALSKLTLVAHVVNSLKN